MTDSSTAPNNRHLPAIPLLSEYLQGLVKGKLWLQVCIAMVLGIAAGIAIGPTMGWVSPSRAAVIGNWMAFPGQLFLALIQMIVIPLIFASIVRGLSATEDTAQLKKMGFRVVIYFVVTTGIAAALGIWLTLMIRPGEFVDRTALQASFAQAQTLAAPDTMVTPTLKTLPQQVLTLLPSNPLTSMVESNMLQIVIFAMVIGVALVMMSREQARPLLELMGTIQEVCMTVVRWAMWLAPYAVFGLLAQLMSKIGLDALIGMAVYVATVLLGLFCLFVMFMVIAWFGVGRGPISFLKATRELLLLAFSTSSSAAVMPLSIKTAEEKLGVRPSVSQFVIPLGATINMNGTALYQGVAAIFLAQIFGIDVSTGGMVLIVVTAVGASIGSPATPGVGIVVLATVVSTVGVPPAGIALIMGVDRILDMSRTALNVSGDVVASMLVNRWTSGTATEPFAPEPSGLSSGA